MGISIDVLTILALGVALALVAGVVGALYVVWVVETFLVV